MSSDFKLSVSKVTAVVVTFNRDVLLRRCLEHVNLQSHQLSHVVVVDNAVSLVTSKIVEEFDFIYAKGSPALGGAGGYELGMKLARDLDSNYVWLLDDDGYPSWDCLEIQIQAAVKDDISVTTPLCVDAIDSSQTSNPYILGLKKVTRVDRVSSVQIRRGAIQLFNGALLDKFAIEKIGYPNRDLYIRGDELDYFYRIKRAALSTALVTRARYFHPSSSSEYPNSRTSILGVIIPTDEKKKFYQFRNQGYLVRTHRLLHKAVIDWLRYSFFFLILPGRDFKGFRTWVKLWLQGFALKLDPYEFDHDSRFEG